MPHSHDQTRCFGVDLHIARQDADVFCAEGLLEVSELLVRERFDGRRVHRSAQSTSSDVIQQTSEAERSAPGHVLDGQRNGVLGDNSLTS